MTPADPMVDMQRTEERRARRFLGLGDGDPLPDRHQLEERVKELRRDLGEEIFEAVMRRVIGVPNPSVNMLPLSALAETLTRLNAESEARG